MFYRSYIVKNHNGIYYFRFIIPKAFQCLFPNNRREIRRTLKTRTKSIALTKARKYKVYMDEYLNQLDDLDNSIGELEEGYKLLSH